MFERPKTVLALDRSAIETGDLELCLLKWRPLDDFAFGVELCSAGLWIRALQNGISALTLSRCVEMELNFITSVVGKFSL